ncbi:MAG: RNA polymerase sigma factor [Phycisphaerae bacterium]
MESGASVESWLRQAAGGDRLAVQKLILLYHGRLRSIAARRIPRSMRAKLEPEDILQEVYADVIRRIGEFQDQGESAYFRWLTTILASKLADAQRFFRAAARDVAREIPAAARPSGLESLAARVAFDSVTPSRIIARREAEALLMAAMAGLSDDHRRVLRLRFLEGCPLAEVAKLMNRTAPAVQMLSARALRRLRRALVDLSGADVKGQ